MAVLTTYTSGNTGYVIYSNGLCAQWGMTSFAMRNNKTTISLPKTFANTNFSVTLGKFNDRESNPFISSKTASTIVASSAYTGSTAAAGNCHWRAVGYLKADQYTATKKLSYKYYVKY